MTSGQSRKNNTSSGKKTTGSRRSTKRTAAAKNKKASQTGNPELRREIFLIFLFVLCILLFISNFGVGGAFGMMVGNMMFGVFGLCAYLVPVILFIATCFCVANKENGIAYLKVAAGILACVALCGLVHIFMMEESTLTGGEVYRYCAEKHLGGGWIGASFAGVLTVSFGRLGAVIILAAFMIIAMVIVSERSFLGGVREKSKKVYDTARVESEKHRERQEEKAALQKTRRVDRKVSGVNLSVKMKKDEAAGDNMKELRRAPDPKEAAPKEDLFLSPELSEIRVHAESVEKEIHLEEELPVETPAPAPEPKQEKPKKKRPEKKPEQETSEEETVKNTASTKQPEDLSVQMPENVQTEPKYVFPPIRLLSAPKGSGSKNSPQMLRETAAKLQQILHDFGVSVTVTDVSCGPAVTRYEVQPDQGVKVSRIVALSDDIKLNLAVADIRIEAPIPGKAAVGIEVPNKENSTVTLREILASEEFQNHSSHIAFAVGKDIAGKTIVTDIAKMPHLLIAGATGSGKSVCINTLIMSLLYKSSPEDVKLIMIDPKVVELSAYNGIPHLYIPVVTDPKKAAGALNWAVAEMTRRYQLFAEYQVRNLQGYNEKVKGIEDIEDENKPKKLPQIVIIVDELADLMMVAPGEVEDAICRLAQLARAAGIHLIIATQRPSVNVITGLIKANMPSRIAFAVSSGVDSRTIIDMNGAEKLLGKGDMLFYPYGYPKPVRIQGAFVSDDEVGAVVDFLKNHNSAADYSDEVEEHMKQQSAAVDLSAGGGGSDGNDPLFAEAGKFIIEKDKASIGMLQRWFKIGFNRAARIMDQLSEAGVVGEEQGTKPREVLMSQEQFEQYIEEYL